jgi:hypothetical protein
MVRYRIVIVGLAVLLVGGGSAIGLRHGSDRVIAATPAAVTPVDWLGDSIARGAAAAA